MSPAPVSPSALLSFTVAVLVTSKDGEEVILIEVGSSAAGVFGSSEVSLTEPLIPLAMFIIPPLSIAD